MRFAYIELPVKNIHNHEAHFTPCVVTDRLPKVGHVLTNNISSSPILEHPEVNCHPLSINVGND